MYLIHPKLLLNQKLFDVGLKVHEKNALLKLKNFEASLDESDLKTIFDEILVTFHEESMENILYIIKTIQDKYSPKYFLAIADFIDLVYQRTFLSLKY